MFTRTKLLAGFSAVIAGTLIYGVTGTGAYFDSSDNTPAHTFATGTLTIDLRDNGGNMGDTAVTFGNMAPGQWTPLVQNEGAGPDSSLNVYNYGSLPAAWRLTAIPQTGSGLFDALQVKAYKVWPGDGCGVITGATVPDYSGSLSALSVTGENGANISREVCFSFGLPSYAGNEYQGLTTTFILHGHATQVDDPVGP